jgi:prolyl 4-hydroxylase
MTLKIPAHHTNSTVIYGEPHIVLLSDFLSHEECDQLIEGIKHKIEISKVVEVSTGNFIPHAGRTSSGSYYERSQTELVSEIEKRISELLNWPIENGEGIQVLNYQIGQEYLPHFDYFPNKNEDFNQRVGTFLMYLNTPEKGGGTAFPDLKIEVPAKKGSALFFSFDDLNSQAKTLHAGLPVIQGEKWVATKWLRKFKY